MSAHKHTPGPWRVGSVTNGITYNPNIVLAGPNGVASVYGIAINTTLDKLSDRDAQGLANARLIASSPALYAALEALVSELEASDFYDASDDGRGTDSPALTLARAALAKARGEA